MLFYNRTRQLSDGHDCALRNQFRDAGDRRRYDRQSGRHRFDEHIGMPSQSPSSAIWGMSANIVAMLRGGVDSIRIITRPRNPSR